MSNFIMPLTQQQEQFSQAWLHAVASVAGYSVEFTKVDIDTIDARIVQFGKNGKHPKGELVNVQLKCTYARTPKNGSLKFPLDIRSYDRLRPKVLNPRILLVLHVPSKCEGWLSYGLDQMVLQHCAYWTSLTGKPSTKNIKSVTIDIPLSQKFTVNKLKQMMNLVAKGQRPEELLP